MKGKEQNCKQLQGEQANQPRTKSTEKNYRSE